MERKDLLKANAKIFKAQGIALEKYAKKTCKIVVVGNPANTNCLIASRFAPSIPKENFTCLTRLDHSRAIAQVSSGSHVMQDLGMGTKFLLFMFAFFNVYSHIFCNSIYS